MAVVDDVRDTVLGAVDDVRDYLASPEGRDLRRKVATGLVVAAPLIARLPVMRASFVGRVLGFAGGAAVIVKVAEVIRDWEPSPPRR